MTTPKEPADAAQVQQRKLVPVEPTEAMHQAAVRTIVRCTGNDDWPPRVWRAMLAASPPPATEPAQQEPVAGLTACATCGAPAGEWAVAPSPSAPVDEAVVADARRLAWLWANLENDGYGFWLPETCWKAGAEPPTMDELREAIDAAISQSTPAEPGEGQR